MSMYFAQYLDNQIADLQFFLILDKSFTYNSDFSKCEPWIKIQD